MHKVHHTIGAGVADIRSGAVVLHDLHLDFLHHEDVLRRVVLVYGDCTDVPAFEGVLQLVLSHHVLECFNQLAILLGLLNLLLFDCILGELLASQIGVSNILKLEHPLPLLPLLLQEPQLILEYLLILVVDGFEEVGDHALHERDQNNHNADVYAHEKDGDFAEAVVPFRVVEDDGRPASLYHNLHDHKMSLDQVPERTVFIVNVVRALLCNPESVVEPLHPDYAENVETRHEQREQPQTHKSADVKLVEQQSQPLV